VSAPRVKFGARLVIVGFVLVGLMFTSVYPIRRYLDFRHHIAQLHAQQKSLQLQQQQLQEEAAQLKTPAEIERLARAQLGMVRPGEVPFVIMTPGTKQDLAAPVMPAAQPAQQEGFFSRWWHGMSRAFSSVL
jgi:cell division protein FtsL